MPANDDGTESYGKTSVSAAFSGGFSVKPKTRVELVTPALRKRCPEIAKPDAAKTYTSDTERLGALLGAFSDLRSVAEAWPDLSETIRNGILAMIKATGTKPKVAR